MEKINRFLPVLVIFLVWLVFASPYFLQGKVPFPADYLVNNFAPWSAYPGFAGPVKNAATPDVITQIFPWKALTIDIWKSGSIPLWNPYSFSGTPNLANYQSAALSPLNLLYFVLPFINAWSFQVLLAPLLAGIFTYLFTRSIKISQSGSVISSIAFMFCGFIVGWMPYGTLPYAILFLPLALFSIEKFFETKKWYFSLLLCLTIPLSFFSGHFQISLYFFIFVTAYLVYKYFRTKELKQFILNLLSIIFGLLLCAPQLLPSLELYSNAVRSSLFLKIEVIPWGYLSTLLAPDFLGNPVTRNDWFGHYAEWNAYIGIIPLTLAFYAFTRKSRTVVFFTITGLAAILFSFQSPIVDMLIAAKIPVISTSALGRVIVLFSFSFAVLAGIGYDNLFASIRERKFGYIILWMLGFLFCFTALWLVAVFKIAIPAEKAAIALSNLKLPTLIFITFTVTVVVACIMKHKNALIIFPVIVILLVGVDMVRFANKWMPFMSVSLVYPNVKVTEYIDNIGYARVFGNFGAESYVSLKMQGVDGYDPLFIARYGEFLNSAQDGLYHMPDRTGVNLAKKGQYTPQVINLLGIKYFFNKIADGRMPWAFPVWEYPVDQFRVVYQDEAYQIFENDKAFSRAFIVGDYSVVQDKRKILKTMFKEDVDLAKTVILEENPGIEKSDATGSAKIIKYQHNRVRIEAETNKRSLLVLTDPFYPGWKAIVNRTPAKIYRADYAFRAIVIPAGKSTVEFAYEPESFRTGLILAGLGVLGMLGLLGYNLKRK